MKAFIAFCVLLIAAYASADCQDVVIDACKKPTGNKKTEKTEINCDLMFAGTESVMQHLKEFANTHITRSYEYLLMSTHYGAFEANRAGFEKLLRELSDAKWKDAIALIKHVTKRGSVMDFNKRKARGEKNDFENYELEVIAKAFDMEKDLATTANEIHKIATGRSTDLHDAEAAHYIEEEFVEKQANTLRTLAGYTTDLSNFLKDQDRSLSYYLFDEYLQKQSFSF